jgi:serine/threonine protein kinase/Flp pilus assembly protein TadD
MGEREASKTPTTHRPELSDETIGDVATRPGRNDGESPHVPDTMIEPVAPHPAGTMKPGPDDTRPDESRGERPGPEDTVCHRDDPAVTAGWATAADSGAPVSSSGFREQLLDSSRGRFEILRTHAAGGLGEVFLAQDRELNREVALKEIQARFADDPTSRARFIVEAEVTGSLDHPGVVPVYSLGKDVDGRPFYAMRFIRGESFKEAIQRFHAGPAGSGETGTAAHSGTTSGTVRAADARESRDFELRRLLGRFVEVCNTIAFAHSRNVLHRDIKPANIMLGPYGETLVVDWGLAKRLDQPGEANLGEMLAPRAGQSGLLAETVYGSAIGTPSYMSPEQSLGRLDLLGPASDIYSLGATLYVLLTGKEPVTAGTIVEILAKIQNGDFRRPREIKREIPTPLEAICLKAMALEPEDRYESCQALAEDLEHWMADEPVVACPDTPWQRLARWGRRHRTWTRAAAGALLVVAVVSTLATFFVEAARRSEHEQRLVSERLRNERQERLRALRQEGEALLGQARSAFDMEDWQTARSHLEAASSVAGPEPELADLTDRAGRLMAQTESRLAAAGARRKTRETYERFRKLHDDALFHGTLFTGLDRPADLEATRVAARAALGLYGMTGEPSSRLVLPVSDLDNREKQEIRTDCYELFLLWADAEATPRSDGPASEDPHALARRGLQILEQSRALDITTRSYHARRASYLERLGDLQAARDESRQTEAVKGDLAVDSFLLGELLFRQGAIEQAIRSFKQALRLDPDHFWAQYFLAVCHLKNDPPRSAEANAHLTACLSRRPEFPWISLLRGYAQGALGEFTAAEDDFLRALELGGNDPTIRYAVLVNRGGMRVNQGKTEGALADLREAARLKPDQYQAHANLALAFAQEKRWTEAIAQFDLAIRLAPGEASLYRNRALHHLDREDYGAALADFEQAIRLSSPQSPRLASDHQQRGKILHRLKKHSEALAAYDAAKKLLPDNREIERLRADTLLALGRKAEAIEAFNHNLDPSHPDPDAYRQRGFERALESDPAGALADYTLALALDPNSPSTLARRGWSYLGDATRLALRDFDQAIKLEPKNADLYNGRGYARALLGDYRGAIDDAEQALGLGLSGAELRFKLALIYNAACVYAQAASKAAFLAEEPQRQPLSRRYQDRAVELIHQAVELLPPQSRQPYIRQILADPALDPVRNYPPFVREIGNDPALKDPGPAH